jgi:hypothetical protein
MIFNIKESGDDFNFNNENACTNSKDVPKKSQLDNDFFSDFDKLNHLISLNINILVYLIVA